jgi:hypothetical protein
MKPNIIPLRAMSHSANVPTSIKIYPNKQSTAFMLCLEWIKLLLSISEIKSYDGNYVKRLLTVISFVEDTTFSISRWEQFVSFIFVVFCCRTVLYVGGRSGRGVASAGVRRRCYSN